MAEFQMFLRTCLLTQAHGQELPDSLWKRGELQAPACMASLLEELKRWGALVTLLCTWPLERAQCEALLAQEIILWPKPMFILTEQKSAVRRRYSCTLGASR